MEEERDIVETSVSCSYYTYFVALSQHDDGLRIMVPHHLPELHYGAPHGMLSYDELTIALKT